jgi:hypothetical protein
MVHHGTAIGKVPTLQQVKSQLDQKSRYRRFGHRQPFGLKGFRQQLVEELAKRADYPAPFNNSRKAIFRRRVSGWVAEATTAIRS